MSTSASVPIWVEVVVAVLLLASAVFSVVAAMGLVRLKDFFQRMHPPALVSTWAAWCVTLASIVYFSALDQRPELHVWLIIILLSITVPVTSILLGRAALFRGRQAGNKALPPALMPKQTGSADNTTPDDAG
ncbi:Na+/H+ antiporter subunit G [Ottowia oryzae]|uniref:Na+/H+ antiporter subunit G n=1 Tax=Ottowia oryzae TaxID=2109914 RepID=A0A2S0MF80_9BURK|nr:Na+/H+ antiporter subunit G [Ottowia oryzae]AVO34421.1 Na+/H+ antiporter subunit G [Ottowia oryzae]